MIQFSIRSFAFCRSILFLLLLIGSCLCRGEDDPLATTFVSPPSSAAPQTWWHWMNGNVTKEGITADLESMKRVGLGGATIVNLAGPPAGKVPFMSDSWRQMVQYAAHESERLGLQLGVENCAGWSSSGGPWVTPEYGMQKLTVSQTQIVGGTAFSGVLSQPTTRLDFYRDIAVLAFPTPAAATVRMEDFSPKITGSDPLFDATKLTQGKEKPTLAAATPQKPQYVQIEFAQPYDVRAVILSLGMAYQGEIQASDDGQTFRKLCAFSFDAGRSDPTTYGVKATSARFYRIVFLRTRSSTARLAINQLELRPLASVDDYSGKADYVEEQNFPPASTDVLPPGMALDPAQVQNLTDHLVQDGHLNWTPPPGNWTVLRIGYTPTGAHNGPAPEEGTGLECDKLSRAALKLHWDHMMAKIIADSGPLAGKTLNHTLIDSYEVGSQNWTPGLEHEFQKRQGYDLTPFLPALFGWVVSSPEVTDRVLWDFRRTVADLFTENYFDYMGELARQSGLLLSTEPYGNGPFDDLSGGRGADVPMTEFWAPGPGSRSLKLAGTIAHIYGKKLAGAESFTGAPDATRWQMYPALLKALGDFAFTCGINHMSFHRFAHQPWLDRVPGMTAGPWGTMLERTNTWWEPGTAWIHYLTRCQYLLQQGQFVADALVLTSEGSPSGFGMANVPSGYDWDGCNADVVFHRLSVKDGRLTLPDGMSYRVLALAPGNTMTPELLEKLGSLAQDGATIIGPEPSKSPSFRGYPQCDAQVKTLAETLWKSGKISNRTFEKTFSAMNLPPDFECVSASASFAYIHRADPEHEIYFISNQHNSYEESDCFFRLAGKVPELWDPNTGKIEAVPIYTEEGGRTRVHLRLDPIGSVFVVFRSAPPADHAVALNESAMQTGGGAGELEITHAAFESATNPAASIDVTDKVKALVTNETLSVDATNARFGEPAPMQKKQLVVDYTLNGKPLSVTVAEGGEVNLPDSGSKAKFTDAVLKEGSEGKLQLQAWRGGTYAVKSSAGNNRQLKIDDVPAAVTVTGPWQIAFQPNRGAPAHATLDSLTSWSDNEDSGIKYFSGTATYTKSLTVDPALVGEGRRLYLDLGDVQVIAEVKLNGTDLGILWKPPFGVDVTDAVHAGENTLEVKVTNLWVNRLIGDEQLPPDCDWRGGSTFKEWPQWLLDDKPSPTGHITFTTWRHWNKDDPLKPSGLLGPVVLVPSRVEALP